MIEVKSLSKRFGDHWALKNTTWSVQSQRSLGLLGPNGAGKSTTMKIMTGLLCSTEGEVFIDGQNVMTHPVEAKRKIGYLPETPPLYEDLKVCDFFEFVCGLKSVEKKQRSQQIDQAIEKLSLQKVAYKPIRVLSKGFRQRVGIAQTLIGDPSILILDEPSVGLDPHQVYELRNIIKGLKKDHIIILSTHILSEVQQICDDVVILDKGEVKTRGSLNEILRAKQAASIVQVELVQMQPSLKQQMSGMPGVSSVEVNDNKLELYLDEGKDRDLNIYLTEIIQAGGAIKSVTQKQQALEEVFIEVTK